MPALPDGPTHAVTIGRVVLDLPTAATYADGSNGGIHDGVSIEEQLWPQTLPLDGRERDDARAADWAARVADADRALAEERDRARVRQMPADGLVLSDRAIEVQGAGWARVLSWPDYAEQYAHVVVVADVGRVRLVSEKRVSASAAPRAQARFADVLGAYVPAGAPGYGGEDWLYLRHGAVARPPTGREVAAGRFTGHPEFEELRIGTETRLRPHRGQTLLQRWRETQSQGLGRVLGGFLPESLRPEAREVRAGRRAAGPFDGEEVVGEFRMDAPIPGETAGGLLFEWEHIGTPGDGHDPDLQADATTPAGPSATAAETQRALAAWDALLASVRPHR